MFTCEIGLRGLEWCERIYNTYNYADTIVQNTSRLCIKESTFADYTENLCAQTIPALNVLICSFIGSPDFTCFTDGRSYLVLGTVYV